MFMKLWLFIRNSKKKNIYIYIHGKLILNNIDSFKNVDKYKPSILNMIRYNKGGVSNSLLDFSGKVYINLFVTFRHNLS